MTLNLDGKLLSDRFCSAIKKEVEQIQDKCNSVPCLGVILVGDNPASKAYVANKEKIAKKKCGFNTVDIILPVTASEAEVAAAINKFNKDNSIDGILLQLPLPAHLNTNYLLDLILPSKDVDGLHPVNQGLLLRGGKDSILKPCTPAGVMALIDLAIMGAEKLTNAFDVTQLKAADLSGKTAVVIGRSILVGKPVASLLLERNATVISAHSKTKNLEEVCSSADILVAAVGRPLMFNAAHVKPGAIVIDVGINRISDGSLVGDVDYKLVAAKCSAITPVPGGVGPMTIAMLMKNTLIAFKAKLSKGLHD